MSRSQDCHVIVARVASLGFFLILCTIMAQAQSFTVLHEFTGGPDGSNPYSSLALDRSGNLYGVTPYGGNQSCETSNGIGCGVVFKLEPKSGGWIFYPLYAFTGHGDGANPAGNPAIAPNGVLYGTTDAGGNGDCRDSFGDGCGTVFLLRPPASLCRSPLCPWDETQLYRFTGGDDGNDPWAGVALDQVGNLYGTTYAGGSAEWGVAFEVSPDGSGWSESTIHTFTSGNDGANPTSTPVLIDGSGTLYGTTSAGGNCSDDPVGCGTVFQLTASGSGWNENILYNFPGSYGLPLGGLVLDPQGNIYGSATSPNTVFELSNVNGEWTATSIYSDESVELASFRSTLARDAAGNLYGTSEFGGNTTNCVYGCGFVYELTPSSGGWTFTELYEFTGGSDGEFPIGGVAVDSNGNIYGTAYSGGTHACGAQGCGVAWEISQ